jgi:threonine synthase
MGEGCTPLVEHPWRGGLAYFKLEWFAPTGSFKDIGASVMISALRQQGVTRLLEDSSEKGGAAIAAYAAGGIKARILVPAHTQPVKTVQMRALNAQAADETHRNAELGRCRCREDQSNTAFHMARKER